MTRLRWFNDLVRLEIILWERVDARLRADHGVSMAQFEALLAVADSGRDAVRVGDLAQALAITVGGASKLADRVVASGLLRRDPDPDDRRASRLALTADGRAALRAATTSYEKCLAELLDPVLTETEREGMHAVVSRLLEAARPTGPGG
ncbi:MAG TPA: MarR family winged helix-turn-helix transcriptional regulator [Actinoplanes sp.]